MGQYCGMSAVQGGPGFPFFSPVVFQYLTTGQCFDLKLTDDAIPDPEIRNLVSRVRSIFLILIVDSKMVVRVGASLCK